MSRNVRIVPAILTDEPATLRDMVSVSASFTDYVQIDIMDGQFVPSRSVTIEQLSEIPVELHWEAHLMVSRPQTYLETLWRSGAGRAIFHYEALDDPSEVIAKARITGLQIGLAINPGTPVEEVLPFTAGLDSVLFLSVNPGYYGSEFLPEVTEKVRRFRNEKPNFEIGIDGGIKKDNIGIVAGCGVDYICVGSAIFLQPDPAESYRQLLGLTSQTP